MRKVYLIDVSSVAIAADVALSETTVTDASCGLLFNHSRGIAHNVNVTAPHAIKAHTLT
jgi:hypothetical protein